MKKAYQIDERRAIEKFRSHLQNDHGAIQMILPLAEIAQKLRSGVTQFLLQAQLQLLMLIMEEEINWMAGPAYQRRGEKEVRRWGNEGHLLRPYPTTRALHPIGLHHHRRRVLKAGQIAYFPLADFVDQPGGYMLPTPRTNQLHPSLLPPHPQLQLLALLVNLHPIDLVSRPSKNPRPIAFPHPFRLSKDPYQRKLAFWAPPE